MSVTVLFIFDPCVFKLSSSLSSPAPNPTDLDQVPLSLGRSFSLSPASGSPFESWRERLLWGKSFVHLHFSAWERLWMNVNDDCRQAVSWLECKDDTERPVRNSKSSLFQGEPAATFFTPFTSYHGFYDSPTCPGL